MAPQADRHSPDDRPVTIRFRPQLRERIDAAAEAAGVSRTAWLSAAAEEKLTAGHAAAPAVR